MGITPLPSFVQNICLLQLPNSKELPKKFFRWHEDNQTKATPGNINVLLSYNIQRVITSDTVQITSSLSEKLLGMTYDSELKFAKFVI